MSILRQLPFLFTALLSTITLLSTVELVRWNAADVAYLYDDFGGEQYEVIADGELVIAAEGVSAEFFSTEDALPAWVIAGVETYNAGIAWATLWEIDEPGAVHLVVGLEIFEERTGDLWNEATFEDSFHLFTEPSSEFDELFIPLSFDEPGLYTIITRVEAEVELDDGGTEFYEAEAFREVTALPPTFEDTEPSWHAAPYDPDDPDATLIDRWAWQGHPCDLAFDSAVDDLIAVAEKMCDHPEVDDPEYMTEIIFELLHLLEDTDEPEAQWLFRLLVHQVGLLATVMGDWELAEGNFTHAAILHAFYGDTDALGATLHNLGVVASHFDDEEIAAYFINRAIAIRKLSPDSTGLLLSTAQLYRQTGENEAALIAAYSLDDADLPQIDALITQLEAEE